MKRKIFVVALAPLFLASCGDDSITSGADISDAVFTNSSANCSDYAGTYTSSVTDVNNGTSFSGSLTISTSSSNCSFETNSIPNHDFNDGDSSFATDVGEVDSTYTITTSPSNASSVTELTLGQKSVIFLNGAVLDILPAACYGVGSEPLGQEKIGCTDDSYAWRYDPMYSGNDFGTDSHNAHAQPSGLYHYHGNPNAMFDDTDPTEASPVIGFAPDGYPVYGPYVDDNGTIREVTSSYDLRSGTRDINDLDSGLIEGAAPGGTYNGTYRDDWYYNASSGDLDECNGMTVDGQYGYYITNEYPWAPNCFKGTPSF